MNLKFFSLLVQLEIDMKMRRASVMALPVRVRACAFHSRPSTKVRAQRDEGMRIQLFVWGVLAVMAGLLAACVAISDFSIRADGLSLGAALSGPLLTVAGLG